MAFAGPSRARPCSVAILVNHFAVRGFTARRILRLGLVPDLRLASLEVLPQRLCQSLFAFRRRFVLV